jgi:hypothetical protein
VGVDKKYSHYWCKTIIIILFFRAQDGRYGLYAPATGGMDMLGKCTKLCNKILSKFFEIKELRNCEAV